MLKSKMDVRVFAVQRAAEIMGTGTPDKDVVAKAKEIEAYVSGDVHDEVGAAGGLLQEIFSAIGRGVDSPAMAIASKTSMKQETEKKSK